MTSNHNILLYLLYRFICLVAGILLIMWGYKLFRKGILPQSGDLDASWGSSKIKLVNAAP